MKRGIFPQMMIFLQYLHWIISINVRFPIHCRLGHFIQWSYQLLFTQREKCPITELFWSVFSRIQSKYGKIRTRKPRICTIFKQCQSLLILYTVLKSFNVSSACLLEIEQAQSNLSAWLVSMKTCAKGISIWLLYVQIKVHKENIRTKRETSQAHSEPFQTSKTKLFAKILDVFQKLLYCLYCFIQMRI